MSSLLSSIGAALAAALALSACAAAPAHATRAAYGDRAEYLRLAEQGAAKLGTIWWNPNAHWYTTYPFVPSDGAGGLATLWDVAPVFETLSQIALADPTPRNRNAVLAFATGAERYWDPTLPPSGGYAWLPGQRGAINAFFDDNGWWGLDFFDAYRATHDPRLLRDAARAFRFIVAAGWAARNGGGVWWDTGHTKKTSEPLAAAALLGALLYVQTHADSYLVWAKRLIRWGDLYAWNKERRLYQRNELDPTVLDYVEGMMAGADAVLCRALHDRSWCAKGERLARAAAAAFPPSYHWATETDAIYFRWLLELYATTHDARWYGLADGWAQRAVANARDARGIFSRAWDGGYASDDRILTSAGTLMLFASLAAAPAPR